MGKACRAAATRQTTSAAPPFCRLRVSSGSRHQGLTKACSSRGTACKAAATRQALLAASLPSLHACQRAYRHESLTSAFSSRGKACRAAATRQTTLAASPPSPPAASQKPGCGNSSLASVPSAPCTDNGLAQLGSAVALM